MIHRATQKLKLRVDGRNHHMQLQRSVIQPPSAPRLIVVAYQPNTLTQNLLKTCIQAIQRYTSEPHELWIIDNNSPLENVAWLFEWPEVNVALNRTEPIPPGERGIKAHYRRWRRRRSGTLNQSGWGSYANAVALELAVRIIEPDTHYLMTLHMDTIPCHPGWLSFLQSKLGDNVAASGVRMDRIRTPPGVLHVLGYMLDFQLFRRLQLNFLPQLPQYDVGDLVTVRLREAGYEVFACRNTMWQPELINEIDPTSPLRNLHVDRALDDEGNVIFMHLGRGVAQTLNRHTGKTTPEAWIEFAKSYLL
jgi:hypothetical protein